MKYIYYFLQDVKISFEFTFGYLREKLHLLLFCRRFDKHVWSTSIFYRGQLYQKRFFEAPNLRSKCIYCNESYYDYTIRRLREQFKE